MTNPTSGALTHFDNKGDAHMVNISEKNATQRKAVAQGRIYLKQSTLDLVQNAQAAKGDVLGVARVAGIMAAKRTSDLIPLCHPLPLTKASVDFAFEEDAIRVTATAATDGKTGVEMEALTATSTALLTIYDMAKAIDKAMVIDGVCLLEKQGGKSGDWVRG